MERACNNEKQRIAPLAKTGVEPHEAFAEMDIVRITAPENGWDRDSIARVMAANQDMVDEDGAIIILDGGVMVPVRQESAVQPALAGARAYGGTATVASLGEGEDLAMALKKGLEKQGMATRRFLIGPKRFDEARAELGDSAMPTDPEEQIGEDPELDAATNAIVDAYLKGSENRAANNPSNGPKQD
jgi:hypothetical protein